MAHGSPPAVDAPWPPIEDRIVLGLTPAQRSAVLHGQGPLLIIAGAGTGKTTVLTRRIAHLITSKTARPSEILALTFTEKAALEMEERVDQLIPYGYVETAISTFHSFGDRVLREFGLEVGVDPGFRVLTQPEQVIFLREHLFDLPLDRYRPLGDPTRHLQALVGLVSRAKDEDLSPERYRAFAADRLASASSEEERDAAERDVELAAFYEAHQRLLAAARLADFGDLIGKTLTLLRDRPAVLARLRKRYQWILVDEFQDTNHAQLELLRLLAGEGTANITVVGDDDQAIYRWRGAAAANLLSFRRLYPPLAEVVLVDNHRSTQPILDASARLISHNNPYRLEAVAHIDKRLRATRPGGVDVLHLHHDTVSAEADGVAEMIVECMRLGDRPRDIAILVRSNADADPYLRAMNVKGIPHRFSGSRGLYGREEVRILVSFLRTIAAPDDSLSVFHLAGCELYRMPEADLLRLNRHARRHTRPLLEVLKALPGDADLVSIGGQAREGAARLLADLQRAVGEAPHRRTGEVLYGFLQWSGFLARLTAASSAEAEVRVRNIARFFDVVKSYGDLAEHDRVPAFVAHLEMLREAGDDPAVAEADVDDDAVHVLTVHKAKGLEFASVFVVGCVEQRFPVRRHGEELAPPRELLREEFDEGGGPHLEERRLFYVAMTRARDRLVLTSAADYGTARPRKVSRFVVEALGLAAPGRAVRKSGALEALAREGPAPEPPGRMPAPMADDEVLRLSFAQIDDFETCAFKYRYVHVLRVPLLTHHAIVYGHAVHEAVRRKFEAQLGGRAFGEEDLVAAFRWAWVSEGFLSREHEERRLAQGEGVLRRFAREQAQAPWHPVAVEQEFAFDVGKNRVSGRYDLVLEDAGGRTIVDFKTGDVREQEAADRRARESLQLDISALAHLRTRGDLPGRVELRFLETGLVAGRKPTHGDVARTEERIRAAAAGIRARAFSARPTWLACTHCPFREICPHTAAGP